MNLSEFQNYLQIDKLALDEAIERQPQLLHQISDAYAEAVAQRDTLKNELEVLAAEIDHELRDDFERAGTKYTEAVIKSQIITDADHQAAYAAYAAAKLQADKIGALKDAFRERGYMLKELAQLFIANYYEQSSVRGTDRTDAAVYSQRRNKLAAARERKNQE